MMDFVYLEFVLESDFRDPEVNWMILQFVLSSEGKRFMSTNFSEHFSFLADRLELTSNE